MAVYAGNLKMGQAFGVLIGLLGFFHGDAELVGFQAGGNVGMGLRVHIGVDAQ